MQIQMAGDVTTYRSIAGYPPAELERRIGYGAGRLARGFEVFELVENVTERDFIWKDTTSFSGGWQFESDIGEFVQRADERRFEMARQVGFDDKAADRADAQFMAGEKDKLNVREGQDRIVKIRPWIRDSKEIFWLDQYPHSTVAGIPQWTIRKKHEKLFKLVARIGPGGIYC